MPSRFLSVVLCAATGAASCAPTAAVETMGAGATAGTGIGSESGSGGAGSSGGAKLHGSAQAGTAGFMSTPSRFGDPRACGSTAKVCGSGPASFAVCEAGECGIQCRASFADCNQTGSDGCEIDLQVDAKNCGACGRDCLGASCNSGACGSILLAAGQDQPKHLMVTGGLVYWTSNGAYQTPAVRQLAAPGGAMPMEVAGYPGNTWGITADDTSIYWTCNDGGTKGAWVRDKALLTSARYISGGVDGARGIAVEGGTIYWAAEGASGALEGAVMSVKLDGTSQQKLAEKIDRPLDVIAKDGVVYFSAAKGIYKVSAPGSSSILVGGLVRPVGLRLFNNSLYWVDSATGEVSTVPLAGGTPQLLAIDPSEPADLAVDASGIYWVNRSGKVMALQKGASLPVALATGEVDLAGIALDASAVYYTSQGEHSVKKVAK